MNIALIGMPGSGKNTVGRLLAKELGREFYDSDAIIEAEQNRTIPEIFKTDGEPAFREMERRAIEKLSGVDNAVIATGGGAVLNPRNMECLKNGGIIVFINRPLERILADIKTDSRPLLKDGRHRLYGLYEERLPLYRKHADYEVLNDKPLNDIITELIKLENTCH